MAVKCQDTEPRTCVQTCIQWGCGKRTGFAARPSGFKFLLLGSLSSTGELGIVIPPSQCYRGGGSLP